MATFYTDIATNQQNNLNFPGGGISTQPGTFNDVLKENAKAAIATTTYTFVGTEVSSDVINVVQIPEGYAFSPQLSYIVGNAPAATTLTVSLGDTDPAGASATRYGASINANGNLTTTSISGGALAGFATPFIVSADCWLTCTLSTVAGAVTAGKVLVFKCVFVAVN